MQRQPCAAQPLVERLDCKDTRFREAGETTGQRRTDEKDSQSFCQPLDAVHQLRAKSLNCVVRVRRIQYITGDTQPRFLQGLPGEIGDRYIESTSAVHNGSISRARETQGTNITPKSKAIIMTNN